MDLLQVMFGFVGIGGAVCLAAGVRSVSGYLAWRGRSGSRFAAAERARAASAGLACLGLGALLLALAAMGLFGPWRRRDVPPFPMHILDLNAPPADIERVPPPPSQPR